MISQKVKNFLSPELSNLTKNRKTTKISENFNIPPESSEQHLDKVLTVIGLIDAGYLTCSSIVQKLQVRICQVWRKIKNFQTRWKPFILHRQVVTWWSTGYDISRVNLKAFLIDRSPVPWFSKKSEKFCMSGPVKFDEKSQNDLSNLLTKTSQNDKHFWKLGYPYLE